MNDSSVVHYICSVVVLPYILDGRTLPACREAKSVKAFMVRAEFVYADSLNLGPCPPLGVRKLCQ